MDTRDLIEAQKAIARGDEIEPVLRARLNEAFVKIRPVVVRLCGGWSGDQRRGEELAQDVLVEAWRKLPGFEVRGSFQAWVVQIARYKVRNDQRKISDRLTEDGIVDPASEVGNALTILRDEEQEDVLLESMSRLPEIEQNALYHRYFDGLSVEDITVRLGLDNATGARGVLQSARRHLEDLLRDALATHGHGSSFFRSSAA